MSKQFASFLQILFFAIFLPLPHACAVFEAKSKPQNSTANSNVELQIAKNFGVPRRIAILQDQSINESSGLAVSHKNENAFWTHNDSGDNAFLYAFNRAGRKLGVWRVANAKNVDWEDIAAYTDKKTNESYLFIGDIGNNERTRGEAIVYRVVEPKIDPSDASSSKKNPRLTQKADAIRIGYPDMRRDAETLLVNPNNGDLYVISKSLVGKADIYKLSPPFDFEKKQTLKLIGQVGVPSLAPGFLTGGSFSPDGRRVVLCDYFAAYEFVLPSNAKNFDDIWTTEPERIDLGERAQGESICYSNNGTAVYATSEKRPTPLIEVKRN